MSTTEVPTEWPKAERRTFQHQNTADVATAIAAVNTPNPAPFTIPGITVAAGVRNATPHVARMYGHGWFLRYGKRDGAWLYWLTPDGQRELDLALFDWDVEHVWVDPKGTR